MISELEAARLPRISSGNGRHPVRRIPSELDQHRPILYLTTRSEPLEKLTRLYGYLTIVKARGSNHVLDVQDYRIAAKGIEVGPL